MKKADTFSLILWSCCSLAFAQAPAGDGGAAPSSWAELVARPELWPQHCKILKQYGYGEVTISLDATYPVVQIDADNVEFVLPNGHTGLAPHADTDALAVANAAFAQMSPVQRAFDLEMLRQRADLWPATVKLKKSLTTGAGAEQKVYAQDRELAFGTFDGTWVKAKHPDHDYTPALRLHHTDLLQRVRAVLEEKRRPGEHRVLQELDGKLVSLRTGRKARMNAKRPPDYVVLYFSAGWCGPCHAFSPQLVRFYEQNKKLAGKRFEIIWVSWDRSEAEMKDYAKEFGFPWLAVAWDRLGDVPITRAHDIRGIPSLVVLDEQGALVADSYVGDEYRGADAVLQVLTERLRKSR